MHVVKISDLNIGDVIDMVADLKRDGLVQGTDFDFAFRPGQWDYAKGEGTVKHTEFRFYHERHAVFYSLKWS